MFVEEFSANITVKKNFFSDHDAVRILVEKKIVLIFILFHKTQYVEATNMICFLGFLEFQFSQDSCTKG